MYSQVIIKDSIEIKPSQLKNNKSTQITTAQAPSECMRTNWNVNFNSLKTILSGYTNVSFTINGQTTQLISCGNYLNIQWNLPFWTGSFSGYYESSSFDWRSYCYDFPPAYTQYLDFEFHVIDTSLTEIWYTFNYGGVIRSGIVGAITTFPLDGPIVTIINPMEDAEEVMVTKENMPVITIQAEAPEVEGSLEYFPAKTIITEDYLDKTTGEFIVPENQNAIYYPYIEDKQHVWINESVKGYNHCGVEGRADRTIKLVSKKSCPKIQLASNRINPGDTISLTIVKEFENGITEEYPSGTKFFVELTEGLDYGYLLVNGELSSWFDEIEMPIQIVAASAIDLDTAVVSLHADLKSQQRIDGTVANLKSKNDATPKSLLSTRKQKRGTKNFLSGTNQPASLTGCNPIASLVITKEELLCPVVSIVPATIKAGETANVIVKGKKDDGVTIVDYPAGTQFTFTLTNGAAYGTFAGSVTSITTTSPAQFTANANIDVDSTAVTIHVAVGGGSTMAKKRKGDQTKATLGCVAPVASVGIEDEIFPVCNKDVSIQITETRYDDNGGCGSSETSNPIGSTNVYYGGEGTNIGVSVCKDAYGKFHPKMDLISVEIVYGICTKNKHGVPISSVNLDNPGVACSVLDAITNEITSIDKNLTNNKNGQISDVSQLQMDIKNYYVDEAIVYHEQIHVKQWREYLNTVIKEKIKELSEEVLTKEEAIDLKDQQINQLKRASDIQRAIKTKVDLTQKKQSVKDEIASQTSQMQNLIAWREILKTKCK